MDMRQLKYFVRVAELGSITKAAAAMSIAQPALSRHIRELETELGATLLTRNGRGVLLTEAGERFLARARAITLDADSAREEVRSMQSRPSGPVSVAMAPSAGAILWIPLVARVQQAYPEIQLQLHEGYSGHVVEWLAHGTVDLGVVYQPQHSSTVDVDLLITETLYLLGAAHDPVLEGNATVDFKELAKLPMILPTKSHAIRRLVDQVAAKRRVSLNVWLEVNAYPAIKSLVIARRGFTVLPVAPVLPEVHIGQIAIAGLINPTLTQTVGLITSSHRQLSLAGRTVRGLIRDLVAQLVKAGRWPALYRPPPDAQ